MHRGALGSQVEGGGGYQKNDVHYKNGRYKNKETGNTFFETSLFLRESC